MTGGTMQGVQVHRGAVIICFFATTLAIYILYSYWTASQQTMETMQTKDVKDAESSKTKKGADKIDRIGRYLPYYGYTVISFLENSREGSILEEYIRKSKTLSKYLSPLPISSYHVTVFDIFSQRKIPSKYVPASGSVPSERWSQVMHALQTDMTSAQTVCDNFQPELIFFKESFSIRKQRGRAVTVRGNLNTDAVLQLRKDLLSIFGETTRPDLRYHMTLAYLYRDVEDIDNDMFHEELTELWSKVQDSYRLKRPRVCYFESMAEFLPLKKNLFTEDIVRELK